MVGAVAEAVVGPFDALGLPPDPPGNLISHTGSAFEAGRALPSTLSAELEPEPRVKPELVPIREFELAATTGAWVEAEPGLVPARRRYLGDLGERTRGDREARTGPGSVMEVVEAVARFLACGRTEVGGDWRWPLPALDAAAVEEALAVAWAGRPCR